MLVSTYNVNSINARLPHLLDWLARTKPDIALLQEIKCTFNDFPFFELNSAGYQVKMLGQKSYNGVAVLSPYKLEVTQEGLPDFEDENARYLEALVHAPTGKIRVASVYLPNGNPPYNNPDDNTKFEYKLRFMDALYRQAAALIHSGQDVILGGDMNVILTDNDVYEPTLFKNNALCREPVRQRLTALSYLGFYDAFRLLHPKENGYTYWDYAGKAFEEDAGMRIDYLFVSPTMADCLQSCFVDTAARRGEKPSDHTVLNAVFDPKKTEF